MKKNIPALVALFALSLTLVASARSVAAEAPIRGVLYTQPFTSQEGIEFWIDGEVRAVHRGHLLVVEVDPAILRPTDAPEPKLFVGGAAVRKVNQGIGTGRLVILTPTDNLTGALVWFSEPTLLRHLDAERLAAQRRQARSRGQAVALGAHKSGLQRLETLEVEDLGELYRQAARLVLEYAPEERARAESYLLAKSPSAP